VVIRLRRYWGLQTLLYLRVATGKVVKGIGARLGAVDRKGEVVILEVEAHTRKVDDGLDSGAAELLGITFCLCQLQM
jgi:hypothetical protein